MLVHLSALYMVKECYIYCLIEFLLWMTPLKLYLWDDFEVECSLYLL